MPESFVIAFNHREIENPPPVRLARTAGRTIPATGLAMKGRFITHPEICAKVDGERQTFTIHPCGPQDPIFAVLPSPRKGQNPLDSCISCNTVAPDDEMEDASPEPSFKNPSLDPLSPGHSENIIPCSTHLEGLPAAEIVNGLNIEGEIMSSFRGKELVIAIDRYIIRVGYALEAHSFWIRTDVYNQIVASAPVQRGKKSKTFMIPSNLYDGPPGAAGQFSIQAAFICPDWTLIFADHNVMITFHVMAVHQPISKADLRPGSKLWQLLWSSKHGPVFSKEPNESKATLEAWRINSVSRKDDTPIFLAVKADQRVFNGFGAQETCDMLFRALISPITPAYLISQHPSLWLRFKNAVTSYQVDCLDLLRDGLFPYVSTSRPFHMKLDAHHRFLQHVDAYRRQYVWVDQNMLSSIHKLNLLDPSKTIDADGIAKEISRESIYSPSNIPRLIASKTRGERLKLPNYVLTFSAGKTSMKKIKTYTPFTAQTGLNWWPVLDWAPVDIDVKNVCNSTTLGPYSFQVFVGAGWTAKKTKNLPAGRRPLIKSDAARMKRPLASQIAKTSSAGVKKSSRNILANNDENEVPLEEGKRMLRSGKKICL